MLSSGLQLAPCDARDWSDEPQVPAPRSAAQAFTWLDHGNWGEQMRAVDLLSKQRARIRRRLERHLLGNLNDDDDNQFHLGQ